MTRRWVSTDIPEPDVGSKQAQPVRARILRDLLVTGGRHPYVPDVNGLVTAVGDYLGYGARQVSVDDESQLNQLVGKG